MNHDAEVAHDTTLLDLLIAFNVATAARTVAVNAVLSAATTGRYADHRGQVQVPHPDIPMASQWVDISTLPVGTIYWQSRTFMRGEGDRARTIITNGSSRPTTLDEALAVLDTEAKQALSLSQADAAVTAARSAIKAHEVAYTGWPRFFLVTSSSGHVHSSMHCSTCYPTTTYAPVVDLSGCSQAEAVDMLGETLCSVCFPSAPVNSTKLTKSQARKFTNQGAAS